MTPDPHAILSIVGVATPDYPPYCHSLGIPIHPQPLPQSVLQTPCSASYKPASYIEPVT